MREILVLGVFKCGRTQKAMLAFGMCILLLFCLPAFSQLNLGRITGAVTDQTGGAIANATVTVTDVARGTTRTLTTDQDGQYNAPSLQPGTYSVRGVAMGFQALQRENVALTVGADVRVDLTLVPGEQTQTVTVTESLPIINATNATLGGTIETQTMTELPLNGRSVIKLLNYVPGATTTNGNDYNINGGRNQAQSYVFDGIDEFNPFGTGPIVGGTSGFTEATILPLDSVQETNIVTNPTAEYGWKYGGVINIGIKSGTNGIHGTAFAEGRDSALETRPAVLALTSPKPNDTFEQFGATIGGPIKKDKLFYFLAFEGQRYSVGTPAITQVPAALAGAGPSNSFADAINDMLTNPANVNHIMPSALSLDLAGCPTVAPYTPCTGGIFGNATNNQNVSVALPNFGGSNNGLAKADYHLNDKNSINVEYFHGLGLSHQVNSPATTAQVYWDTIKYTRSQLGRAVWVFTPSSNFVNEMRFGGDREYQSGHPAECGANAGQPNYATAYHFVIVPTAPPTCGFPQLSITGFTSLGTTETGGGPTLINWTTYGGIDTVSLTHGAHQLKIGGEVHDSVFVGATKLNYIHGRLTFGTNSISGFSSSTPLEDFLAGQVTQSQVLVGSPLVNSNYDRYALFFQDDWRVTHNLIVNLGVRWEIVPPMTGNNQLGSFSPTQGMEQVGIQIPALYKTYYGGVGPRLGLAWDVTGKGTTVVRAGGSLVDDLQNINSFLDPADSSAANIIPTGFKLYAPNNSVLTSPGTLQTANLVGNGNSLVSWLPDTPVFNTNSSLLACGNGLGINNPNAPNTGTGGANPANPQPCAIQPTSQNFKPGYLVTWTVGVQHALTTNASINIAYVGSRGQDLSEDIDVNQPTPGAANTGTFLAEQLRRPFYSQFPYLGQIQTFTSGAASFYNAMQADFKLRATHGLTTSVAYTYAHVVDNADAEFGSHFQDSTNPRGDYGPAGFDYHHNLSMNFIYQIPGVTSRGAALREATVGWQVTSIISVLGTKPYNATDGSDDFSGTGQGQDRWDILGNPNNIRSGIGNFVVPCFGVPNSSFAKAGCTTVAAGTGTPGSSTYVANMPAACISSAAAAPQNATMNAANAGSSNGLLSLASKGCYYENGTAITPPAQGTFGTMGRNVLRGDLPFREIDLSLAKQFTFGDRLKAQFRADVFNLFNKPVFSGPSGNLTSPSTFGSSSSLNNSGDPILGPGGPRQINLELKLIF